MVSFEEMVDRLCPLVETPWGWATVRTVYSEAVAVAKTRMSGKLSLSPSSGWALLSVPNAFVVGVFKTLEDSEPGVSLPISKVFGTGRLNAHISIANKDELNSVPKGTKKIRDRAGDAFHYQLGELKVVTPPTASEFKKAWYVAVKSPELEAFRRSLGLSRRPNKNKFEFHISCAGVRR